MNETKIRLSPKELELIRNADIILTKNAVMKKMQGLLEELQVDHQELLANSDLLPEEVRRCGPKISKGENYLGLPYLVLDQPRFFEIDNIFAIRTMFWWGRFFSITLQLSGRYKKAYQPGLINHFDELKDNDYYYCVSDDQWKHHLEEDNYIPLKNMSREELIRSNGERSFIKLAKRIELGDMENIQNVLDKEYRKLLDFLRRDSSAIKGN